MNNQEKLEIFKRKLLELEEKVKQLNEHKLILINISNELDKGTNIKLNNLLHGIELQEEVSYLNDWIGFYKEKIERYKNKIEALGKEVSQQELGKTKEEEKLKPTKAEAKEVVQEKITKEEKPGIKFNKTIKALVKYVIPFVVLSLIITSLLLLKPAITGHVVLSKETTYNESLNLNINESGTYKWNLKNLGSIKSLKATGSVIGNGTIKIYIEKDGKKYLIYKNK